MNKVGNNGNQLVEVMHDLELLKDGMSVEDIMEVVMKEDLMLKWRPMTDDSFWEDVFYRAEELGYKLFY